MAILPLVTLPNPQLRTRSDEVDPKDISYPGLPEVARTISSKNPRRRSNASSTGTAKSEVAEENDFSVIDISCAIDEKHAVRDGSVRVQHAARHRVHAADRLASRSEPSARTARAADDAHCRAPTSTLLRRLCARIASRLDFMTACRHLAVDGRAEQRLAAPTRRCFDEIVEPLLEGGVGCLSDRPRRTGPQLRIRQVTRGRMAMKTG